MHFLLPPLILRLYTGCRLDQTLSKCIASLKKSKSAKMLGIGVLFICQTVPYSFCACVRNTPKIWKDEIGVFQFISRYFPTRPKMPFGQRHDAIIIYNICKGHFGSRAGKHLKQTKRHQFHCLIARTLHGVLSIISFPCTTLVNVYVDLLVFTRIAGTS